MLAMGTESLGRSHQCPSKSCISSSSIALALRSAKSDEDQDEKEGEEEEEDEDEVEEEDEEEEKRCHVSNGKKEYQCPVNGRFAARTDQGQFPLCPYHELNSDKSRGGHNRTSKESLIRQEPFMC